MGLRDRLFGTRWTLGREWFRVWEVPNYYTTLERLAHAGARITFGYVLMTLAAALLATSGLLLNSATVVIGSMCVAPFLGPSRAVCIGALYRDRRTVTRGLLKQLAGLLAVGPAVAYATTVMLRAWVSGVEVTPEVLLRAMPTARDVVLSVLIATTSGAAASLALSADPSIVAAPWGQVLDAMIGVEIAISLMPPACVMGIGLAFGRLDISRNALLLLLVNVLGLDFLGSMLVLAVRGVRARYLNLEKAVRRTAETVLSRAPGVTLVGSVINVTLLSPGAAKVDVTARHQPGEIVPDSLAQTIGDELQSGIGCRGEVTVDLIPSQTYTTLS